MKYLNVKMFQEIKNSRHNETTSESHVSQSHVRKLQENSKATREVESAKVKKQTIREQDAR